MGPPMANPYSSGAPLQGGQMGMPGMPGMLPQTYAQNMMMSPQPGAGT
eukprot:CAMPEP_0185587544 /NCGR_PEP_ID=MMETSP0434-20130131/49558_1 /TAXON_ID=626734 ORGANISM="Favella taraikaensis, Strain Fe Narragansett Bay" /NCGR_SAMPLE_ID=MMETSP0434 /ASSEMBLY_ACC=CAM_ASM_000379 /LENGTH=47 /DNA_ID= /DNA_START= /DNA_END= /DNA_ORIENTATION=